MTAEYLSDLIVTDVLHTAVIHNGNGAKNKRYDRPCWAIILKYEGETVYTQGEHTLVSNIENAVILPRGSSYEWHCTSSGHYRVLEFQSELTYDKVISCFVKDADRLLRIMSEIEYRLTVRPPMYMQECIRDIYSLILRLTESSAKKYVPGEKQKKLAPAVEYLLKNIGMPVKNDELAAMTGLSTVYFRKLFTEIYGVSPKAYSSKLRINKAKDMLRSDHTGMTDIALALGYNNVYEFSRDFKKHTGIPPSKF